jgi:2-polyprenyl-3-methyl-5-hydroxy-6-metoxy-1,4-benzoquinol methylase
MTQSAAQSWINLMRWRTECHQRFGAILDLPITSSPQSELHTLLRPGLRVLDVGAGAHKPLRQAVTPVTDSYFSLDTDPDGEFDYRSFEDITPGVEFDLVVANQVLEHLSLEQAFEMARSAFQRLSDGGHLLATVPNAAHPVRQRDCTHVTAWPVNDLYSLVRSVGFEVVSIGRYNKFPLTTNPVKRWIVRTVCEQFRMDWCDSIVAVGVKPPESTEA